MGALMIQGTGSNVGKSLLVAGLCRAARRRGIAVAPFKPQNMSNNAAVACEGGEIGRAQALQALAAGLAPSVHMNPVLLKPETDRAAQVVVQGHAVTRASAGDYGALKARLLDAVLDSFARLRAAHDLVLVEGAGSPAEVNLRARDIANMGFARAAGVPVVLAGDIDRGGVIAQIVGTQSVIAPADAAMIKGFLINRFRGDPALFDAGRSFIAKCTGWPDLGLVPWFADAARLPAEDAVDLRRAQGDGALHVVCPMLSRIANFDDLDPLAAEPGLRLSMVPPGQALPGDADVVILPGSKSTRGDLAFLRGQGWDIDLAAHLRRGGHVLGICGGYQMLGRVIHDPEGHDGAPGSDPGLALLDVETRMVADKRLTRIKGRALGQPVEGYEIHMGRTTGPDCARPFAHIPGPDGATSADGRVAGTYLHGLFTGDAFRAAWLARLGVRSALDYGAGIEEVLDSLADHLETHLDIDRMLALAREAAWPAS
ncbi:adenosylcobyric acid synthase (glutamine-hydrolysing) [Paracoccus halophilus]|uniref:Cobyric acid synthase n=1 Tax=Paracoccus halophilus TaxID=376733 RepID=A0A099EWU7_9RHOB|nr:cobyric acid synthase [Paracoccus halophilus]KGJ02428.1 cobalamin biosynthesis protein CobQ [Paracoccus halophilus]SFA61200.1 adenosylcobyric acid synthase (glutamine-hydrolysing) [Paracoccus halophilus]